MSRKFLRGAAYALGERQYQYSDIVGLEAVAKSRQIPLLPDLMGFGSFCVTQDVYERAGVCVDKTLAAAAITPQAIDLVIFCSSCFKERIFRERNEKFGKVLKDRGINPKRIIGVSGSGCTDVLSSVDLACRMLQLGAAHDILIVTIESYMAQDSERLLGHALISDAAASMIVSDRSSDPQGSPQFEILVCEVISEVAAIGSGMSITSSSPNRDFVRNVLAGAGKKQAEVAKIFGNNVYLPIKTGREGIIGFTRLQMYLDNVRKNGHCLGCDSIINLVDFGSGQAGHLHVLYAEAEGHTGCVAVVQL